MFFLRKEVMCMTKFKIGREAKSGQFIPVHEAKSRPNTTVVETIKIPTQPKRK
jgi:hypothetical protein